MPTIPDRTIALAVSMILAASTIPAQALAQEALLVEEAPVAHSAAVPPEDEGQPSDAAPLAADGSEPDDPVEAVEADAAGLDATVTVLEAASTDEAPVQEAKADASVDQTANAPTPPTAAQVKEADTADPEEGATVPEDPAAEEASPQGAAADTDTPVDLNAGTPVPPASEPVPDDGEAAGDGTIPPDQVEPSDRDDEEAEGVLSAGDVGAPLPTDDPAPAQQASTQAPSSRSDTAGPEPDAVPAEAPDVRDDALPVTVAQAHAEGDADVLAADAPVEDPYDISSGTLWGLWYPEYLYEGSPVAPNTIQVWDLENTMLEQGVDYDLVYSNNDAPGTATCTVVGIGSYYGTLSKTFEIVDHVGGTWGTCTWQIDSTGRLEIGAGVGADPYYDDDSPEYFCPWLGRYDLYIRSAVFAPEGGVVVLPANSDQLFYNCYNLVSVDMANVDATNVKYANYMFSGCYMLESLDLSAFYAPNLVRANGFLEDCDSLGTITVGDGWSYDLPYNVVNNQRKWFSTTDQQWYSIEEVSQNRRGLADTYTKFADVDPYDMTQAWCAFTDSYVYTGSEIELQLSLYDYNGEYLYDGQDYTVTYENNVEVGTARAIVTGMGGYYGTLTIEFTILDATPNGTWGTCEWDIDDEGTLTIHAGVAEDLYSGLPWNVYQDTIKAVKAAPEGGSVVLPRMCSYLFSGLSNVRELDLSGFDFSAVEEAQDMFFGCSGLKTIDLSPLTQARLHNTSGMFCGCSALETLDVTPLDTALVEDMSRMFMDCASIRELDVSSLDTGNAFNMYDMFNGMHALENLDVSTFDTSNVADMDAMFANDWALESVNLSGLNTGSVVNMYALFLDCRSLRQVYLSGIDTSSVMDMESMFSGCSSLERVDLGSFDTSAVCWPANMFEACNSLSSITVSERFTLFAEFPSDEQGQTKWESNSVGAEFTVEELVRSRMGVADTYVRVENQTDPYDLYYCSISFPDLFNGWSTYYTGGPVEPAAEVVSENWGLLEPGVDYTIEYANNIEVGTAIATLTGIGSYHGSTTIRFDIVESTARGDWGTATWEMGDDGTLVVSSGMGQDTGGISPWDQFAHRITAVSIAPEGGTLVLPEDASHLFGNCDMLQDIDLSHVDTSGTRVFDELFSNCTALRELDLSMFDTSRAESMEGMFSFCRDLCSVDIASFDTSAVENMSWMFFDCPSLTSLDLSGFDTSSVRDMSAMFKGCGALESLDVSSFDTSAARSMASMFNSCYVLASLDLSTFDTHNVTDMTSMFCDSSSLAELDLSSFDTSAVRSFSNMFMGCSSLATLDLTSFVTSMADDMSYMFYSGSLKSLTVGERFSFTGDGSARCDLELNPEDGGRSWSVADQRWYSAEDIALDRSGIADTYTAAEDCSEAPSYDKTPSGYARMLYGQLLDVAGPTDFQVSWWAGRLSSEDPATVVADFAASNSFGGKGYPSDEAARRLYSAILGNNDPTEFQVSWWAERVRAAGPEGAAAEMTASDAFKASVIEYGLYVAPAVVVYDKTPEGYARMLYGQLLDIAHPTDFQVSWWAERLSAETPAKVVADFAASNAFGSAGYTDEEAARRLYSAILGNNDPTDYQVAYWAGRVSSIGAEAAAAEMTSAQAFDDASVAYGLFQGADENPTYEKTPSGYARMLYGELLDVTEPSTFQVSWWANRLAAEAPATVVADFAASNTFGSKGYSPEEAARRLYAAILGNDDPSAFQLSWWAGRVTAVGAESAAAEMTDSDAFRTAVVEYGLGTQVSAAAASVAAAASLITGGIAR